jgi:hypothetical protein
MEDGKKKSIDLSALPTSRLPAALGLGEARLDPGVREPV